MKKSFSKFMTIIFAISLGLFITLGIITIIIGPSKTEDAIKSLFKIENYKKNYKEIFPIFDNSISPERNLSESNDSLSREIKKLSDIPPLLVPTSGIAPRAFFLYTGPYEQGGHEGIDIWTNINGTGTDGKTYYKGNPVYAACSGVVSYRWDENGDVSIICDELNEIYEGVVPSRKIKTLYGHMADMQTRDVYIYIKKHQRVEKGDLIGHQGNLSFYAPENLMVHLHFGVYDISSYPQKPLDPSPYIGVSCTKLNQEFEAGVV